MTNFVQGLVERCADDESRAGLLTQLVYSLVRTAGFDRERVLSAVELALKRVGQPENATDIDAILRMYERAGIEPERNTAENGEISLTCVAEGREGSVRGWPHFVHEMIFDGNGKLVAVGAWE